MDLGPHKIRVCFSRPDPWQDNAEFSVTYPAGDSDIVTFNIQDLYQPPGMDVKWSVILGFLETSGV
jgi:hypothetical protein